MRFISAFIALLAFAATTGCASNTVARVTCSMPSAQTVDGYVAAAAENLSLDSCHSNFDSYFKDLMDIAVENPAAANKAQFAKLIRAGIDAGAISSREGKRLFNEYFEPEFFALKGEARSNCVALRQKDDYFSDMNTELQNKKTGLLDVLGDETGFRLSQRYYQDLVTVIDAVGHSCEASLARR